MGDASLSTEFLRYERNRRSTFERWPQNSPVGSDRLARAGFYYSGNGLEVVCYLCKKSIWDWTYNDQAMQKHRQASPQCDFVRGISNNVPLANDENESHGGTDESFLSHQRNVGLSSIDLGSDNINGVRRMSLGREERRDRVWSNFISLKKESERLKTFRGWPLDFIDPKDLAHAGLFYLRQKDMVQCVFCRGVIMEWERGDLPMCEHARHFPRCPLVLGEQTGNVTIEDEQNLPEALRENPTGSVGYDVCGPFIWDMALSSAPERSRKADGVRNDHQLMSDEELGVYYHGDAKYPLYASPEARRRTFVNWSAHLPQRPDSLLNAGFFYAGVSDYVKCFCCGGGLRNWERDDDPWTEHARWFITCNFVMFMKGREFVLDAITKKPPSAQELSSALSLKTDSTESVNEVRDVELPETCTADLDKKRTSISDQHHPDLSHALSLKECPPEDGLPKTDDKLLEENRTLKEMRLCKICMDEEVGVVLQPCRHIVCCVNCAPALQDCPVCRKAIFSSARVFFS